VGQHFTVPSDSGDPSARFALRQVDDDSFELLEPFKFDWKLKGQVLEIRSDLIGHTDLASIPTFLGWFRPPARPSHAGCAAA
jgi:hypothetical protein